MSGSPLDSLPSSNYECVIRSAVLEEFEVKSTRFLFLSFLTFILVGTSTLAEQVIDYDRQFDFSALKKFAWLKTDSVPIFRAMPGEQGGLNDEEADQLIKKFIGEELKKKKFESVDPSEADFLVSYVLIGRLDMETQQFDANPIGGIPYGHWRNFYEVGSDAILLRKGTLSIDILQPDGKKLVWRASLTDVVKKQKEIPKKIEKAVKKLIKKFPPK